MVATAEGLTSDAFHRLLDLAITGRGKLVYTCSCASGQSHFRQGHRQTAIGNVVGRVLPLFGPMKRAEERALNEGEVLSEESKKVLGELPDEELKFKDKKCRSINFIAPILLVAVVGRRSC